MYAKGVGAVYNTTLLSATATIDLPGIIDDYAHLQIKLNARGDTAATTAIVGLRFNNDSGANYYWQRLRGTATTASAAEGLAQNSLQVGFVPADTAPAAIGGSVTIDVPSYANATLSKGVSSQSSCAASLGTGGLFVDTYTCVWNSAAAINRVTLSLSAGNFAVGSQVTLYGMGR